MNYKSIIRNVTLIFTLFIMFSFVAPVKVFAAECKTGETRFSCNYATPNPETNVERKCTYTFIKGNPFYVLSTVEKDGQYTRTYCSKSSASTPLPTVTKTPTPVKTITPTITRTPVKTTMTPIPVIQISTTPTIIPSPTNTIIATITNMPTPSYTSDALITKPNSSVQFIEMKDKFKPPVFVQILCLLLLCIFQALIAGLIFILIRKTKKVSVKNTSFTTNK